MKILSCPMCGASVNFGSTECQYCRTRFTPIGIEPQPASYSAPASPSISSPTRPPVPENWIQHENPFLGFAVAHPSGWEVMPLNGRIRIQQDPLGLVAAWIWPFRLPSMMNAQQLAAQFIGISRQTDPGVQAWQSQETAHDPAHCILRTISNRYGKCIEGRFNIIVNGSSAIISGLECPREQLDPRGAELAQILSTFRIIPPMPQKTAQEPGEGAFRIRIPDGWIFQGGVNRQGAGGKGLIGFTVTRDPQGLVSASQPVMFWTYMDGMASFFPSFGGPQPLPFHRAADYCSRHLVKWMQQYHQALQIENIQDRPDLAFIFASANSAASGIPIGSMEASVALMTTTYIEGQNRIRQNSRIFTYRQVGGNQGFFGGPTSWLAGFINYYRAPMEEFGKWEPILLGILDTYETNPAWQQSENQLVQNNLVSSAQDRSRRLQQISRTLSETSDIITQGYWERQSVHDRLSHQRSNAILGYQDMTDPSGQAYSVPVGYDRYWIDGLGNAYGGNWMTQPDIHWQPLELIN